MRWSETGIFVNDRAVRSRSVFRSGEYDDDFQISCGRFPFDVRRKRVVAAGNWIGLDLARTAAIKLLKRDPYGATGKVVAACIASRKFAAHKLCSSDLKNRVFRIAVRLGSSRPDGIEGYLLIDVQTGETICAGLPAGLNRPAWFSS